MSDQPVVAVRQPAAIPTRMSKVSRHLSHVTDVDSQGDWPVALDPDEAADRLFRDLRTSPEGLSLHEAQRRPLPYGPNSLQRRRKRRVVDDIRKRAVLIQQGRRALSCHGRTELAVGRQGICNDA